MPTPDDQPTASLNGLPPASSTVASPPPPPPGSTVVFGGGPGDDFERWVLGTATDRYRLGDFHKGGGLGQVWKATDTVLDREVAVKLLRPDRVNPGLVARFVREAKVTGRLEHPNIVPVYDLVQTADGPAYAMRFVRGQTLAEAAKAHHAAATTGAADPLGLPRLLNAVALVCEAVAFAHSRGVLHRDLKGQNILLGPFGEVCLADWGLAKVAADPDHPGDPSPLSPSSDGVVTEQGAIMGTLAFMAPELARKEPATPLSDVYGLGAVLYQVLTAAVPNAGSTPEELLSNLQSGVPALPARQVNPGVPAALAAVCEKALRHRPADRYESAAALAADLRAYLAGEPVAAYPEPFRARAERWVKRHRAGVLAAVVGLGVFALAAGVGAVLLWQANNRTEAEKKKAEDAKAEADRRRDEADRERDKAQALYKVARDAGDSAVDALTEVETGRAVGPGVAGRLAKVGRAAADAEKLLAALPDDPDEQERFAQLLRYTCTLARLTNNRKLATESADRAVALRTGLAERSPNDPTRWTGLAFALEDVATVRTIFSQLPEATAALDRAVAALDRLSPADRDTPNARRAAGLVLLQRANVLLLSDQFDPAAEAAGRAADLFAGLPVVADKPTHDPILHGLAHLAVAAARREKVLADGKGDFGPAVTAGERAVEVLDQARRANNHPDAAFNYHRAVMERAATKLAAGSPSADLMAGVDAAIAEFTRLKDFDPGMVWYKQMLAASRCVRGDMLAKADRAAATAEYKAAEGLWRELANRDSRDRADYALGLLEVLLARTKLADSREGKQPDYTRAGAVGRGLRPRANGVPLYERAIRRLEAAAKADGCDLSKKEQPAKP